MQTKLYWIDGVWPGRLAIMPRPRGGDWLEDEVLAWRAAGVDLIVSMLEEDEIAELELVGEPRLCKAQGIEFMTFPIIDRGIPNSIPATVKLVRTLESYLTAGKKVVIHCRQGVGRSALIAACLLALSGLDADTAFDRIGKVRGCKVPDTNEQRAWLNKFAREVLVPARGK